MIEQANREETAYILSNAALSANEGLQGTGVLTQEKAEHMLTAIMEKGAYHLVYKDRDKVGGWIMIGHNTDYFTEKEIGFIYDVYILPDYRGRGLSKKLVEAGISELKEKGYEEVRLNVFDANFAKGIYEKMGFEPLQTIMVYK
ncbi:GNAT family N-acetyltransferase [Fictibacillus sp. KIGAM418]|uniref:GNAT family N-acetyltransferase n=1 Tax=Fictibacillus marinisediminis TaxID=2878389 RepID=A0A9X1X901_9BACL|nr:GNAT family N-acetyltransferase [Fictibacillus marinisediminis]MCK6256221.1 GNAT family N-acetyltransferase [Fictibacillus marinisediminis]